MFVCCFIGLFNLDRELECWWGWVLGCCCYFKWIVLCCWNRRLCRCCWIVILVWGWVLLCRLWSRWKLVIWLCFVLLFGLVFWIICCFSRCCMMRLILWWICCLCGWMCFIWKWVCVIVMWWFFSGCLNCLWWWLMGLMWLCLM